MSFTKSLLLFLSFTACVSALVTPHAARSVHHRHALVARGPAPAPLPVAVPRVLRKRASGQRCRFRSVSSSAAPTNTPVINAAPSPPTFQATPTTTSTTSTPVTIPSTTPSPPPVAKPTTQAAAAPATQAAAKTGGENLPSFMVGVQTGQGTFYSTGLGACGITNTDADYIVAVSHLLFDAFPGYNRINPNSNPLCGKKVQATYQGKSVTVAITDRCEGCAITDLDFSPSAFNQIADFAAGRISGMTWVWV